MKFVKLLTLTLLMSVLATAFILAQNTNNTPEPEAVPLTTETSGEVDVESAAVVETLEQPTAEEVEETLTEVAPVQKVKRVGFLKVTGGHGWMDDNTNGFLLTGLWAVQGVAEVVKSTKEVQAVKRKRGAGRLIIFGKGKFKLIKTDESDSEDSVSFYLVPIGRRISSIEDAASKSRGTMKLSKKQQLQGLTKWTGTITLDSISYNVELATRTRVVKRLAPKFRKIKRRVMAYKQEQVKQKPIAQQVKAGPNPQQLKQAQRVVRRKGFFGWLRRLFGG